MIYLNLFKSRNGVNIADMESFYKVVNYIVIGVCLIFLLFLIFKTGNTKQNIIFYLVGVLYGLGALLMGFARISLIKGLIAIEKGWNPTLLIGTVLVIGINLLVQKLIFRDDTKFYTEKSINR